MDTEIFENVSDLHKSARGYRPTATWWTLWNRSTNEEKQVTVDQLFEEMEFEDAREKELQKSAKQNFRKLINTTIDFGAGDVKTAIKWIIQGENFTDVDLHYGADYFCYHYGMAYEAAKEFPIQEVIDELLNK